MFNLIENIPKKKRLLFSKIEEFLHDGDSPPIALIAGMRKTGKTTLLAQIAEKYKEHETILYINFRENTIYSSRPDWTTDKNAEDTLIEFLSNPNHSILLLDEITSLSNYEIYAPRIHDWAGYEDLAGFRYKALITGSSPFHIKALHSGALGGGRSHLL